MPEPGEGERCSPAGVADALRGGERAEPAGRAPPPGVATGTCRQRRVAGQAGEAELKQGKPSGGQED